MNLGGPCRLLVLVQRRGVQDNPVLLHRLDPAGKVVGGEAGADAHDGGDALRDTGSHRRAVNPPRLVSLVLRLDGFRVMRVVPDQSRGKAVGEDRTAEACGAEGRVFLCLVFAPEEPLGFAPALVFLRNGGGEGHLVLLDVLDCGADCYRTEGGDLVAISRKAHLRGGPFERLATDQPRHPLRHGVRFSRTGERLDQELVSGGAVYAGPESGSVIFS